jgi:hypothetical protein
MAFEEIDTVSVPADAGVAELVHRASDDVSRLVRAELQLAKMELTGKARSASTGAAMLGSATVVALYGLGLLLAAATIGLATVMPAWLSATLLGLVLLAIAGATAMLGLSRMKRAAPPVPTEAIHSMRADIDAVKAGVHR